MSPPRSSVHAIRYMRADPASIVQIRSTGYSFNCLPPYRSLDDHLPETHRTWDAFCALTEPRAVRQIAIRYVNRLVLPFEQQEQRLDLDSYLALGPRLPDEHRLLFTGFFHRHEVVEAETGNMATITLTTQPPGQAGQLSVILDLAARNNLLPIPPADWERINEVINSLRALNNHIFQRSLTPLCRARYTSLR